MRDARFYNCHGPLAVAVLVRAAGASLVGGNPEQSIGDVSGLAGAGPEDMSYALNLRLLKSMDEIKAGLCFCQPSRTAMLAERGACAIAVCDNPQAGFAAASVLLATPKRLATEGPWISDDASIDVGAQIDRGARIGAGARIGKGTVIAPFAVIGPGCVIGRNCNIGSGASISFTLMGDDVDIRPGAVLGQAGLGVFATPQGNQPVPHYGIVRIDEGVRIGANSCVDRAVFGQTVIGARSQIDNLVHIGHNVQMGADCVLAAFCGISGSATLGDGVMMGGRAGIADNLHIGAGARIAMASAVMKDVAAGETWAGYPARPLRRFLREQVALKWLARRNKSGGAK